MKQRGFIAIVFVIGCATGGVASQLVVPPVRAGTNPPRWEYLCARIGAGSLTAQLTKMGAEGWELASAMPAHQDTSIGETTTDAFTVCTKRALP
jgi:hypothetical protein